MKPSGPQGSLQKMVDQAGVEPAESLDANEVHFQQCFWPVKRKIISRIYRHIDNFPF